MNTKIQKWGNSLAVRSPKEILRQSGWRIEIIVSLTVKDGCLIISRYKKPVKSKALQSK